jgi:hypothetical protein
MAESPQAHDIAELTLALRLAEIEALEESSKEIPLHKLN